MQKVFYFGLPSVSVTKNLISVIEQLAKQDYEVIYYNAVDFRPEGNFHFKFKAYPSNFNGYYSDRIDGTTSYFQFADILIDTAISIIDFLLDETEREKPDVIIHSHLAVWGRLIANHYQLPAITLYTTFILDKSIMLPHIRNMNTGNISNFANINDGVSFYRKSLSLYKKLQLKDKPDPWDIYINKGDLNISFILESFQPKREIFGLEYKFLGFPTPLKDNAIKKELIYVSMGTIMNGDISFYLLCINVMKEVHKKTIISVGSKVDIGQLPITANYIQIVPYCNQQAILEQAILFISRGGMASVHEAIYTLTPMIVIPLIPEQQITAERIQELGIGIYIPADQLTQHRLQAAVQQILTGRNQYIKNLRKLLKEVPSELPQVMASDIIINFLNHVD